MNNNYEEHCKMLEEKKKQFKKKLRELALANEEVSLCDDGTFLNSNRIDSVIKKTKQALNRQVEEKDPYATLYVSDYAVLLTALNYLKDITKVEESNKTAVFNDELELEDVIE